MIGALIAVHDALRKKLFTYDGKFGRKPKYHIIMSELFYAEYLNDLEALHGTNPLWVGEIIKLELLGVPIYSASAFDGDFLIGLDA